MEKQHVSVISNGNARRCGATEELGEAMRSAETEWNR